MNEVCQEFVTLIAQAVDAEPIAGRSVVRLPAGGQVGQQIVVDVTEQGGLMNRCRLSIFNVELAPAGEAARVEYEHDKQTATGIRHVYSVQSVRRVNGKLELYENFLNEKADEVREEDFLEITSETYGKDTILRSLKDWVNYHAWQLKGGK